MQQLEILRNTVQEWPTSDFWLQGYVLWANDPKSKRKNHRQFSNFVGGLQNGVFEFMEAHDYLQIQSTEIDTKWVNALVDWLKTADRKLKKRAISSLGEGPRAYNTARRQYLYFKALIDALRGNARCSHLLSPKLKLPRIPFPDAEEHGKRTKRLSDELWLKIYDAAVEEVTETITTCYESWNILEGDFIAPDENRAGSGRFRNNFPAVLWGLKNRHPDIIPTIREMQAEWPGDLTNAIKEHISIYRASLCFQPTARSLFPFVLLLYIYSQANTGSLRTLRINDIAEIEGFGGQRVAWYLSKPRGSDYTRSFPIDREDILSPNAIVEFIIHWTRRIRRLAGDYREFTFIFVNNWGNVFPFSASSMPGKKTEACGHWLSAAKDFCRVHSLPHFVIKELRLTGLHVIRERSGDDLLAHKVASGTSTEAVIKDHYEGEDAKLIRSQQLGEAMANQSRWITSNGRIHQRGNNLSEDLLAATPGWNCLDCFNSPRPGQKPGRLCDAFGECPACPHSVLDTDSPYCFARAVQLRNEITDAFDYMEYERWAKVFSPVAKRLDEYWLNLFSDECIEAARLLNVNDLGRLT
ncbi:hypothetical protein [Mitsuaria sp. PDC51]|uniref:hypothetical protein n=1 Tax=Mitsuaria sp. PDC51 TaxID=1881035 RepID=UPI0011407DA4|nr:hypothetical protein [Mitsuaria sp. PDC51]